ncbi:hypothetical protein [Sphingosinicella sp.]
MSDPLTEEVRRRQRSRAILMAIGLFGFVILIYFITIVRMAGR